MTTKAEQALIDANAIVAQFLPLVSIAGLAVRGIIALLRANGKTEEAAKFEDELMKAEAARGDLGAAIAEFKSKYPVTGGTS